LNYWLNTKVPILSGWGCEVKQPTPTSAMVKNEWSYTSTPPLCLHGDDREKVYLLSLTNFK